MRVLKEHPFAAIHVEAPDECTHNGDLPGKLEAIQRLDSLVVTPVIERLRLTGQDFRVLILSDHKTLTTTRNHDGTPVPFALYDSRRNQQNGFTYREIDGDKGITIATGVELMGMLFGDE